jgi:hypothetical protein
MLDGLYEKLSESSVATVIISIAIMLFLGFAATRITKLKTAQRNRLYPDRHCHRPFLP